jgi:hypothetical protein
MFLYINSYNLNSHYIIAVRFKFEGSLHRSVYNSVDALNSIIVAIYVYTYILRPNQISHGHLL